MLTGSSATSYLYTPETSVNQGVIKGTSDNTNTPSSNISTSSLGKDDFLRLLLAEMQHQDPLSPASSTEFVAQLAQFSSLEQLTTMNSSLEATLKYNQSLSESINNSVIVNLIGKTVTAQSNEFAFDGVSPVQLTFELDNVDSDRWFAKWWEQCLIATTSSFFIDIIAMGLLSFLPPGATKHIVE